MSKENIASQEQEKIISALKNNLQQYKFSKRNLLMLKYAKNVSNNTVNEKIIEELKSHNFSDEEIHDICAITSYFCFVNRIANGLNVELEK